MCCCSGVIYNGIFWGRCPILFGMYMLTLSLCAIFPIDISIYCMYASAQVSFAIGLLKWGVFGVVAPFCVVFTIPLFQCIQSCMYVYVHIVCLCTGVVCDWIAEKGRFGGSPLGNAFSVSRCVREREIVCV